MKIELKIPKEVSQITSTLQNKGFLAYLVGGCVRDLILNKKPKDWDITTNAKPEAVMKLFPKTFYENAFGTVTVVNEGEVDETFKNIEITPFRLEAKYSDQRHPDAVKWGKKIEDDLGRRDFTINAIAYDPSNRQIVDLYGGVGDLKDKTVRTVGNPQERLAEDPLRLLRAVRFAAQLGFTINTDTEQGIIANIKQLEHISQERIRDEFNKILMSPDPMLGLILCHKYGLLSVFLPELEEGVGMKQNSDHIYTVFDHTLRSLAHSAIKDLPLRVRLAVLLHDIGKPRTRRWSDEKNDWTFYGHNVVGEKLADKILSRLRFPVKIIDLVEKLARNHMFFSDTEKITLSAVRRIITNVGRENIWDLMSVRECDRIGMGRPKESPYKLRKYKAMIEEALRAPTSVSMLKIDGKTVMKVTGETPGPKIGFILHALLEEVLKSPELNTKEYLQKRAVELIKLPIGELGALGEKGKEKKEEVEQKEIEKIRKKHWVE